jgi:hypothetical protein
MISISNYGSSVKVVERRRINQTIHTFFTMPSWQLKGATNQTSKCVLAITTSNRKVKPVTREGARKFLV